MHHSHVRAFGEPVGTHPQPVHPVRMGVHHDQAIGEHLQPVPPEPPNGLCQCPPRCRTVLPLQNTQARIVPRRYCLMGGTPSGSTHECKCDMHCDKHLGKLKVRCAIIRGGGGRLCKLLITYWEHKSRAARARENKEKEQHGRGLEWRKNRTCRRVVNELDNGAPIANCGCPPGQRPSRVLQALVPAEVTLSWSTWYGTSLFNFRCHAVVGGQCLVVESHAVVGGYCKVVEYPYLPCGRVRGWCGTNAASVAA
jgi:hypothetical protein